MHAVSVPSVKFHHSLFHLIIPKSFCDILLNASGYILKMKNIFVFITLYGPRNRNLVYRINHDTSHLSRNFDNSDSVTYL